MNLVLLYLLLLGDSRWSVRENASLALASLGAGAAFHLQVAQLHPDPEVAWRAGKLLEALPKWAEELPAPMEIPGQ